MEQFDKILEEYRNALGSGSQDMYNRLEEFMPFSMAGSCGHARCTYISEPILPPIHWDCPEPLPEGFCENPECPYLPQDLKRIGRILAAKRRQNRSSECHCNEIPQCFNTDIELETLKQNCPFSNPAKIVNMMQFGSSFAYQEYDSMPTCYNSKLPDLNYYSSLVEDVSAPCSNPDCPLKHRENIQSCSNPECPSKQPKDTNSCSNPDCPLKKPGSTNSCSNPDCPFKQRESTNSCSNPECPFKQRESTNSCSNPDCPLKQRESTNSCSNPDCPLKQQGSTNSCSNPDCPSKRNKKPEVCANPACPFNDSSIQESYSQVDCSPKQGKISKQCSNPNCPFRQISADSCQNPECPLKMEMLSSMETFGTLECALKFRNQAMPNEDGDKPETCNAASASQCTVSDCLIHKQSCSNPDCPLKKEKMEICGNPECPYKSEEVSKRKGICGPSSQSICGDHTCPFQLDAEGDKKRDKQDQLFSGSKDGGGDKEQTEEQTVARTYLRDEDFEEGSPIMTRGDRPSQYDMAPCTAKTCEFLGGKLTCVECATATKKKKINIKVCSGEAKCPAHTRHIIRTRKPKPPDLSKRAMKKERNKFMYHFGDTYPGTHVGHKECLIAPLNVPAKMGWLWNVHTPCLRLKRRNGWRPGLIGKTILEVIQAHRKSQHMAMLEQGKKKRKNKFGFVESEMEIVYPKPTLQIKKRDGVYYITMNPLKDPRTLVNNENPYMECTPMQFKIIKNKEHNEFKSCICNDQGILYEPSSSSDSELDLEFTPPAGVIRPERFLKPRDVIHIDTQYNAKDYAEKPKVDTERGSSEAKSRKKGKKNKKKKGKKKK
ncbi:hypothetical protein WA026_005097 [Henosepilachna vigintioctopunctata]|uniref:DUF4776 domain-containing protein n=1 Tax=Henosepilachna vigintioctopunctata TaxID=420089 RepID=A0AAW1UWD2_9CUCU